MITLASFTSRRHHHCCWLPATTIGSTRLIYNSHLMADPPAPLRPQAGPPHIQTRAVSVPAAPNAKHAYPDVAVPSPLVVPNGANKHANSDTNLSSLKRPSSTVTPSLDLMSHLQRSETSHVKTRSGSVLSRGFILKTDYYPSGRALDLDLNVHGAPNFRAPRQGGLNVFAAAQPRSQGLRAILSVLRCRPDTPNLSHVIWFSTREEPIVYISGRSFVLRDASQPRKTLPLSDRAENLEAIELRLKNDILLESQRFGGLVLTHNEVASDSGDGAILPTWTSVDKNNVRTPRELFEGMRKDGWNVDYYRIPISPDHPIEDNYLDAYLQIIKETDPAKTALVFNCGMGAVRSTFAMIAASLVRRRQIISKGLPDPYAPRPVVNTNNGTPIISRSSTPPLAQPSESRILQTMSQANAQQELSRSLLRMTYLLQQHFAKGNSQSALELLMSEPILLENLRKAHSGSYGIILSLLGCLDHGAQTKKLVDKIIDSCDQVTNLREDILVHRLKYSLTSLEAMKQEDLLAKAGRALEKYFFIIAFASYVEDSQDNFKQSFADWLKTRTEIWNQILFLRKRHGSKLNVFTPIHDLSALSRGGFGGREMVAGQKNDVAVAGGQILGDEYSDYIVKNRSGIILRESMLLKSDQWLSESHHVEDGVRGAINFRNIPYTNIYALGQPTVDAIHEVVRRVKENHPEAERIIWMTLREEPLVYVNGAPYCLRRERFSLRNIKDYGGISASRLEVLEERLRDDVLSELNSLGGSLLLHTETHDDSVIPVWEEVHSDNVAVLKEVMENRRYSESGVELSYIRLPMTAESPPDYTDLSDLIDVVIRTNSPNTPIVVNCQLGRGRSTLASVLLLLIQKWLKSSRVRSSSRTRASGMAPADSQSNSVGHGSQTQTRPMSYQVINNLLRVMKQGNKVKSIVDETIDQCSQIYNLRDSIEEARVKAEKTTDEHQKRVYTAKGLQNLRRYFELIVFQSYLQSTEPDTVSSFESFELFVKKRPVFKTFEKEMFNDGLRALQPLAKFEPADGGASPDEVKAVVTGRTGIVLSASTILKSDFFSNLQKMSLPERIEGCPNFRRVPLTLSLSTSGPSTPSIGVQEIDGLPTIDGKMVGGSGMPTVSGLRKALQRVDAGPGGKNFVFWTSLREEPVIYVAGRPHVLRLVDKPLENVEATGVTTAVVEGMEKSFKQDVIREVRAGGGRILLHDEVEERPGVFSIIPQWETVSEEDIMTPRDVYNLMIEEGYRIDYDRVAITDEQAPLPGALAQLLARVRQGFEEAGDFFFNCQMGRGRTTTGMISACLISTIMNWRGQENENVFAQDEESTMNFDSMDGPSEEEVYLQGEYKMILQLVGVLSHGKVAKRLADRAIDRMQGVQNIRKAIYDYKLKIDATEKNSAKYHKLLNIGVNYLYRYGTLIVFANYLIEMRESKQESTSFPLWLKEHREITRLMSNRSLD